MRTRRASASSSRRRSSPRPTPMRRNFGASVMSTMTISLSARLTMSRPAGSSIHANDRVGGVGEGFQVMAGLGGELHTDEGALFLFGPAEPGQFRPASGRIEGQEKVAVVWATLGTDADFAVHETGILAEELEGMAAAERALIDSIFAPRGPGSAVSGTVTSGDQPEQHHPAVRRHRRRGSSDEAVNSRGVWGAAGAYCPSEEATVSEPFLGEIRMFGFDFAPEGWALCNGQVLPISQNTALFSLLGTVYGGDGRPLSPCPTYGPACRST